MKVLIAEDEFISRSILGNLLTEWGYEVVSAADGDEAWGILGQADFPPLAILDWMMPGMDGLEICRRLRTDPQKAYSYIYIILLTAKESKEDIVAGLEAGADDYVTKPFDAHELRMRVRAGRRIVELQQQLKYYATHDSLTGLLNRRTLFDRLKAEISRAERDGKSVSIALLDLDNFKRVNDTYGHSVGDSVLFEAAQRIRSALREYDFIAPYEEPEPFAESGVGRYGGEEFLVVVPGASSEKAYGIFERIRRSIEEPPMSVSGVSLVVTASLGGASFDKNARADRLRELVDLADGALYEAKRKGRNQVICRNLP